MRINRRGVSTTAAVLAIVVIVLAVAIIYLYYAQIAGRGGQTPSYTTPVQTTQPSGGTKLPYDSASKTVYLVLDTRANLDFNGSTRGRLVIYIPAGWNLEVKYINKDPGNLPHSVGIIKNTTATPKSPDVTKDGELIAWAPDSAEGKTGFLTGIDPGKETSFRASSVPEGVYWIACGVPGHATGGMWIVLVSSSNVKEPYYSTT